MGSHRVGVLALTALAMVVYLAGAGGLQVGQHVDDASYVMLAKSLLSGQGYRQIAYPDSPPETKYPPLLPLLIAPCLWLTGGALWAARLPALLSAIAAVPVLWLLLRRFTDGWTLWLLTALVALHPMVVGFAGSAMTETPSLLVTWGLLLLVLSAVQPEKGEEAPPGVKLWLGTGLLLGLGMLLRTDTLALVAAVVLWLLWHRRGRETGLLALGVVLPLLPWWMHLARTTGGETYLAEAATAWWDPSPLPLRLWHSLVSYLGDYIPQVVTLLFGQQVTAAAQAHGVGRLVVGLQWLASALVVLGAWRLRRQLPGLVLTLVVVRLGMLLGFARATRYLLPVLPFLILFLVGGIGLWRRKVSLRGLDFPAAVPALALLLMLALGRDLLLLVRPPRLNYPDLVAGAALIREHAPPGATVMCTWVAKSFWLYADRPLLEADPTVGRRLRGAELLQRLRQADYVLFSPYAEGEDRGLANELSGPGFETVAVARDGRQRLLRTRHPTP